MTPLTPKELELARLNGSEEEIAEFNRLIAEKHELDKKDSTDGRKIDNDASGVEKYWHELSIKEKWEATKKKLFGGYPKDDE